MGRYSDFPVLLENCISFDLATLKRWGYLNPDQVKQGVFSWGNDQDKSSISITVNTRHPATIILNYSYQGQPIETKIRLKPHPATIGNGRKWFIICPVSGKQCRKLYFINGLFVHRLAMKGVFYKNQVESHKYREFYGVLGYIFDKSELPKYYKTHYSGRPTKRYSRHLQKIDRYNGVLYRYTRDLQR